jgi:hypothetical protein
MRGNLILWRKMKREQESSTFPLSRYLCLTGFEKFTLEGFLVHH